MKKITIAGASGYIGSYLLKTLAENYQIKALSRGKKDSSHPNIIWQEVDLYSHISTSEALQDTDIAIYLVHSMLPATRLFQGSFYDTDLMLADNFAHACKENDVKQVIYLSGVVPDGKMSQHLESRKEVEDVLLATGIPCTILRAGLVVGNGGSSFEILKNLSANLPIMVLPKWTETRTQVIYIDDLIKVIGTSINNEKFLNKTLNITNGENLKYKNLIRKTIQHLGKKTITIPIPIQYTSLSKLWVTVFGESQYDLVSPLVDSLLCDFSQIEPDELVVNDIEYKEFSEMLKKINKEKVPKTPRPKKPKENTVRSIQRLLEDTDISAEKVANAYLKWIPNYTNFIIKVVKKDKFIYFSLFGLISLLQLEYIHDPSMTKRAKFHVVGGLLNKTKNTGWLEFRSIADGKFMLASLNEFVPSLPWYIYKYTQAPIHKIVMDRFGSYLNVFK